MTDEKIKAMLEAQAEELKIISQESEIPLNAVSSKHASDFYFSITDEQSNWGEYDYLTQASLHSGRLVVSFQFLSSDGAPDFGADAIRAMESVRVVPEPED